MRLPESIQQDAGGRHAKVIGRLGDDRQGRMDAGAPGDVVEGHEADVAGIRRRGVADGAGAPSPSDCWPRTPHRGLGDRPTPGTPWPRSRRVRGNRPARTSAGEYERPAVVEAPGDNRARAQRRRWSRRPAKQRDALPAEAREVEHGGRALLVGDADQVRVEAHGGAVDRDDGHALPAEMR